MLGITRATTAKSDDTENHAGVAEAGTRSTHMRSLICNASPSPFVALLHLVAASPSLPPTDPTIAHRNACDTPVVILASDGLYEHVTPDEAMQRVLKV